MNHIEGAILSRFRAGIVAKILEAGSLREGENIHPRVTIVSPSIS